MDDLCITFELDAPEVWELSDAEFLSSIGWSQDASRGLVKASLKEDTADAFRALCKLGFGHVGRKVQQKAFSRRQPKRTLWSRTAFDDSVNSAELFALWEEFKPSQKRSVHSGKKKQKGKRKKRQEAAEDSLSRLERWVQQAYEQHRVAPVELLVLLELLQQAGESLPPELGWRTWRLALTAALGSSRGNSAAVLSDDQRLLIQGELPVAAGAVFNCVTKSGKLFRTGAAHLDTQLEEHTDTDGTPSAPLLPHISLWLASVVRSTEWARRAGETLWNKKAEERFGRLLERTAAICRADGFLALSNGRSQNVAGVLADASRLAGWKKKSPPSRYVNAVGNDALKSSSPARLRIFDDKDHPATQSDWARMACLRNNWSHTPDTLVVAHHCEQPLLDLTALGRGLISGTWDLEIVADGSPVPLKEEWDCTCWFTDDEADFIELHAVLEGGITVDRQLLLSRDEHFALLADAVMGPEGCKLEYASRLPLVRGVEAAADTMSRECLLKFHGVRARAFPLALPDERVQGAAGRFAPENDALELRQQGVGGLFAPVVLDWDPGRRHRYADWRSLTVSENGAVVNRSVAGANRLRIGDHQIFVYRSLRKTGEMRAILGHHTAHETVIGLFADDGEVDPIVIVES